MGKKRPAGAEVAEGGNQWMAFLNLGWVIVGNMVLFTGGGIWLDRRFRTSPWILLAGVFVAFFVSGYAIYLAVKKLESSEAKKSPPP